MRKTLSFLIALILVAAPALAQEPPYSTPLGNAAPPVTPMVLNPATGKMQPPTAAVPFPTADTSMGVAGSGDTVPGSGSGVLGWLSAIYETLIGTLNTTSTSSAALTNPTSTLTLPSTTTAYTVGQLIASSATAGSVVVPSFPIANSAGGVLIPRLRLSTNDTTSTAWGSQSIQVDLWSAAPTFTNGDRGTWSPATGTAKHLGSFTCTMSAEYGDGVYAECAPAVGNGVVAKLASGTAIYWTLDAITGSGVTGASKVFTLTAELYN